MIYDMSEQQQKIFDYIRNEVNKKGYPPSVREICEAVGLKSTSTVHGHLAKLEKLGYIRRDPTKPRAIEILGESDHSSVYQSEVVQIPIVGKVTAGQPILAVENIEDSFPVPLDFLDNSVHFMLKVKGDSMINSGILDGDFVLVKQQPVAKNSDIVVALIGEEATVKRFYLEKDHIRLQPENSFMEPIRVTDVIILGLVKGVFRKM